MMPERDRYQAVLESLADGAEVDWAALDSSAATSAERRRYRNLRLVARVAELHRTLPLDEGALSPTVAREGDLSPAFPSTWGQLHVGERIASGAYGEVYAAHDPQLNRDVALKVLRRGAAAGHSLDQLLAEARTLAQVRHQNVVTIHGAEVRDGRVGLWMELIHGQTLETWLRTHGTMGAGEASALGADVCRALAAVHAAGLVHGDIKAQNVMREDGGRLVLMDFGAGRAQGSVAANVAGTPMYLAPEVLAGAPPTPRSDIYSVGVLLFHLLTRAFPWEASDLDGLRAAHANRERVWLRDRRPDLPDPVVDAIERALSGDPAQRFASAGALEHALTGVSEQTEVVRPVLAWKRGVGFATAAAALLAVIAALIGWSRVHDSRRGVVLSEVRTIGVLPMKDLTDSAVPEHFAEGLTDELIATLGQVNGLTIKSGTTGGNLPEIARALDVDALLETTLLPGERGADPAPLKVRAKLIAAGSQSLLWTRDFERPRGMTLELPTALATAIAGAVHAALTPSDSLRLAAPRQTQPAVEDAYLQGLAHIDQYGTGRADLALKAFQRAIQLDEDHAGAHSGAARAYMILGLSGAIPNTQARAKAVTEARRALGIDQDLAEAHATLAYLSFLYDFDWDEAERGFAHSLAVNSNLPYVRTYYAEFLAARRRFDDAITQVETAKRLTPESAAPVRTYALVLYYRHDFAGAARALEEARAIEPNYAGLPVLESRFLEARGQMGEALDATTKAMQLSGGGSVPVRVQQIRQQALAGLREEALAGLQALQAEAAGGRVHLGARDLAYIYLAMGDQQKAVEEFSKAAAEREPSLVWLSVDPRVDVLQQDPRFQRILLSIGLPVGALTQAER